MAGQAVCKRVLDAGGGGGRSVFSRVQGPILPYTSQNVLLAVQADALEALHSILPTTHEVHKILSHKRRAAAAASPSAPGSTADGGGDAGAEQRQAPLAAAEEFFAALGTIQQLPQKMRALEFRWALCSGMADWAAQSAKFGRKHGRGELGRCGPMACVHCLPVVRRCTAHVPTVPHAPQHPCRHKLQQCQADVGTFLTTTDEAISTLMASARLRLVLEAVRTAGNLVNAHKPAAHATGVQLSSLRKLRDTRWVGAGCAAGVREGCDDASLCAVRRTRYGPEWGL